MAQWQPKIGERAFEVEWCSGIPKTEDGDSDFDNAKYHAVFCRTWAAALARAKRQLPGDAFGSVRITPVERITEYGETMWDYVGDSEHYPECVETVSV